jgi:prephenate dehydratase/prephenate dehydrogenase
VTTATPFDGSAGVAFLGPAGTYSHEAAQVWFGTSAKWLPQADIRDVFLAVETGKAQWGVVPIENSAEGSVTATVDMLATSPLFINAEHPLRIRHCLMTGAAVPSSGITEILSHQQSLGQCRNYLDKHYVGVKRIPVSSNSEAARIASTSRPNDGIAAIAGHAAASLYGLKIVAESIEDTDDNTTRFVLLSRGCDTKPTGKDRTSLLVSAPNEPGALFHALEPFYRHGVSLTKLETRPSRKSAWSYSFYVDFEGHVEDASIKATMETLRQLKLDVKWLGSYRQAGSQERHDQTGPAFAMTNQGSTIFAGKKIVFIGLGLIGGSLARALRKAEPASRIFAVDHNEAVLEQAKADGTINDWSIKATELCGDADVVVLGVPVLSIEQSLRELAPSLSSRTIITDVASVKGAMVDAAKRVFGKVPGRVIPGHPIAGSEQSGYIASRADLYRGRKVIVTPLPDSDPDAVNVVSALWQLTGAEVLNMSVEHHDEVLAATSHLPHLLAFALVDTLSQQGTHEEIFRYAAGGFRDFTRIASSDPVMWRDIFVSNADATVGILDEYMRDLTRLRGLLLNRDADELHKTFKRANVSRDVFLAYSKGQKPKSRE